jgi:hypothetical protein
VEEVVYSTSRTTSYMRWDYILCTSVLKYMIRSLTLGIPGRVPWDTADLTLPSGSPERGADD